MNDIPTLVAELLRLVQLVYPDWKDFSHPQFVVDEIEYKRDAVSFAREQLDRATLLALLNAGDTGAFITRLKGVANKTNLLYMGTPRKGDLAIINQPTDLLPICRAVFDLLYGSGDPVDRLGAFCSFVDSNQLPQRWTFPTYFLFLLDPRHEIFIKPSVTKWLSRFTGGLIPYDARPGAQAYRAIRDGFHSLLSAMHAYGATDMIDVQSLIYVAHQVSSVEDIYIKAVDRLRLGLDAIETDEYLRNIQQGRDSVYLRFRPLFSSDNLPTLTVEDFTPFLDFKINRHWSSIHRYKSRLTADFEKLRQSLSMLADETQPLAERYDKAQHLVSGLGKATATPILHVMYPERYGIWNSKSEKGLDTLKILPTINDQETEGMRYEVINELLLWLVQELDIDLWTLDTLWEWLDGHKPDPLAAPFDAIFADRAQAVWAFDLFADAVRRLGGGPDDRRFALTLPHGQRMMRLNIGNSMVVDIGERGKNFHLTALIADMEKTYSLERGEAFRGESVRFTIYTIPADIVAQWPAELQAVYERSMAEFGNIFKSWKNSNFLASHVPVIYAALWNQDERDALLSNGLPPSASRYWRITMPADLKDDMSDGRGSYNFWADCLARGVAAIGFDDQSGDPQIARFASIRPGDRVVAFLRNKIIGGIGTVTSPLDETTALERPDDQDYFRGGMWRRIGVDWTPATIRVDDLPEKVRHKFGTKTVVELTAEEFAEVVKLVERSPDPVIAHVFRGFTLDAFTFLRELSENNNKQWMEASRERWRDSVLEPMRALFADLGPRIKPIFDPYLLPDTLEIQPTTQRTLAKIYKNWAATPYNAYYGYYWGAFYRAGLTRQTDAQLFVTIQPHEIRFGFYFGESDKRLSKRFNRRVIDNLDTFFALLINLGITQDFKFVIRHEDGSREVVAIQTAEDVLVWVNSEDHDLLRHLTPDKAVALGPALADTVYDAFRRVFPIYLWAVADDPEPVVARYLAAEFPADVDEEAVEQPPAPYTRTDFLHETYLLPEAADELLDLLQDKKQLIFYGPPGTGKTYVAQRLAQQLISLAEPPPEQLEVVQFHPAYAYEEFIEGIRPRRLDGDGPPAIDYPVIEGAFVRFCDVAAQLGNAPCVFIIDEINRGNIPRIFGELMLLLEYRDRSARLPYSGRRFRIPPNVYLIGTMNTADRSIALVDFALRRRFHFYEMAADPVLFERWLEAESSPLPWLATLYRRLTEEAIEDTTFRIGPSAFMRPGLDEAGLARIWRRSVMPYLREYYFDQPARAQRWEWEEELVRGIRGLHE